MSDLLIINPGQGDNYKGYSEARAYEPPLWAGMIANFVRNYGYSVDILDANIFGFDTSEYVNNLMINYENPKLIAVVVYGHNPTASTTVMPEAGRICREIKKIHPGQKIIMIGGHVAALPERTLEEESVDYVSCGEGLYRILAIFHGSTDPLSKYEPPVWDLNKDITGIAWDLLPMAKYRAHNWHCWGRERQPYASIYTSLGCPYSCEYCPIHSPFQNGPKYRVWNPEYVIRQIDILYQTFGVKNIKIADELFVMSSERVNQICDMIISLNYDLNLWAYARIDSISEALLEKLKQAGFNWLGIGIDKFYEKNSLKKQDVYRAVNLIQDNGIKIGGNFIFGFPDDTIKTMQETLEFAIDLNCEFVNFNCLTAYPGSMLYQKTNPKDFPETWDGYAQLSYKFKPLPTKYLSSTEVLQFRDKAFETYVNNPKYLEMIENKFGKEVKKEVQGLRSPKRRITNIL